MHLDCNYLRQRHPRFFYRGYSATYNGNSLTFSFDFEIEPAIHFAPTVTIKDVSCEQIARTGQPVIDNMAFHLGLMEIPSYWKAACSPEIVIEAGSIDDFQALWWQELLCRGLGEFFFTNNIDSTTPDFVRYRNGAPASKVTTCMEPHRVTPDNGRVLVPIGGGKDSAVTCELLARFGKEVTPWRMNPTPAVMRHIESLRCQNPPIVVMRTIDERLLEMNAEGYLNGHTPFSAYLAFASVACAILFGHREVALSNERSSNEGNVIFNGMEINHQYSKSVAFEEGFRGYCAKYLAAGINYFSVLRPLYELQITKIFAAFTHLFPDVQSCNKGRGVGRWCHKCPKCLFVFTACYPFIDEVALTTAIFTRNIFNDGGLIRMAFDLLGFGRVKPFECVGTKEEVAVAFYLCIKKALQLQGSLPVVLQSVNDEVIKKERNMESRTDVIMNAWDCQHSIPNEIEKQLRRCR